MLARPKPLLTSSGLWRKGESLRPCGPKPPSRCRRFAFGFALDNSEFPCYLVWPQRDGDSCALLDTAINDTLQLSEQSLFRPLGMHHFYDSFALVSQISIREDALRSCFQTSTLQNKRSFAKDMAIIQNNSLINMLSKLTGTTCLLMCYVLLKGRLLRTQPMKKQALQLLIPWTVALIRTHKWKGPCSPHLLKTSNNMN